jgi:hypothetical protein
MTEVWIGIALTGSGVLFTIGGFIGRYWMQSVRADIADQRLEFNKQIGRLEKGYGEKLISQASGFRDSFQAIREKISQVELYNEREFISKDTFGVVVAKIEKSIENLGLKIDGLGERLPPRP